jgi:D-glycero-beta-D-manno-heptose 1-phosphate adenylyltransferase
MISENLRKKILNKKQLFDIVRLWKENKDTIVFTNGCFDIIHPGHVTYLAKAAECGTKLIVGVNTDTSVRKLKGSNRPILDQDARALVLSAFSFVDAVVFFDEDTPLQLIEYILPHVLVKGKDYRNEDIVGYDFVISNGGRVETIDLVPGYSTTSIEEKIRKNF